MRRAALVLLAFLALTATAAGAAPFPGTKTEKDRAAWRAILHWPASCERDWQIGHPPFAGITAWRTTAGKRLVEVTCFLGAYQWTSMLFLVDTSRHSTGPLALRTYRDPGTGKLTPTRVRSILGTKTFTPGTGRLVVFEKFHGVGDCGIYSTFHLVRDHFVTLEIRAKTACDGKGAGDPARWPKLPLP